MSRSPYPGSRQQRIVVRETDTYVERPSDDRLPAAGPTWSRTLLQSVTVTALTTCIVWSVAQFADLVFPTGSLAFYSAVPILMSLIGFTTQRIAQRRFSSGGDRLKFQLVELAVLFLAVKLAALLGYTMPELLAAARGWPGDPATFFDTATMVAYVLGTAAWGAAALTARDLEAVDDPDLYAGETDPVSRLTKRYTLGGAVILIFTALTRISLQDIVTLEIPRVRNPILNVLAYFFIGLTLLGQVQFTRLSGLWRREKVAVPENLRAGWLRYSLLFVGLAALVAFVLPTGYTVNLLDLVADLAYMISQVVALLYLLILWPFLMLMSLFSGKGSAGEFPELPSMPFDSTPSAGTGGAGGSWWTTIRSLLFWVVLLIVIVSLLRSYVRDRPGLLSFLRSHAPWRLLASAWRAAGAWFGRLGHALATTVPALVQRLRRPPAGAPRRTRARGSSPRERVIYHYLTTLDRAGEAGWPRRHSQTPREYQAALVTHLAEGQDAMADLTEAFIEARYSTHPITAQDVAAQQINAAQVHRGLHERDES